MSDNTKLFWFQGKPAKITSTLFVAVFITTIGSSMLFGYSMAVLNNLETRVKCFLYHPFCGNLSMETNLKASTWFGSLTTTYVVLGTVGSFSSGFVSDFFGRKNSLWLNNFIAIVGSIISICTAFTSNAAPIYLGRLILGLNAGLTTGIAPTFIAEITPTSIRGAVTACHQLFITIGIVLAYLLTMRFSLNNSYWVYALGIPLIPAILSVVILPFLPESPRYIFVNKNDEEKAKASFVKYNQIQDASTQLAEIKSEVEAQKALPKFRIIDLFANSNYRLPVFISIVLNIMQQFSGINAVIGYSKTMFVEANVQEYYLEVCVLLIGILNTLATIPAVLLMEIGGRRSLLIYPTFLLIFSLILCFIMIGVIPSVTQENTSVWAVISVVSICLYIVGFALGMGPVPGIVVAEMFTQAPRAAAYSLALGIQWFSSFIILFLYPIINDVIPSGYVFIIFLAFVVPSIVFLIIYMPETKNRSFADIAKALAGNKVKAESA